MTRRWCSLFHLPTPLLLLLPSLGLAYPEFTSPAAGDTVQLPTISAQWRDSNTKPLISELTSYTLNLMLGGNENTTMRVVQTFTSDGIYSSTGNGSGSGSIAPSLTGPLDNGFFFQMVSTTEHDTQIMTYSDRFSIAGLTGPNLPVYINAVRALDGSTNGPPPTGVSTSAIPTTSPTKSNPSTVFVTATPTSDSSSSQTSSNHNRSKPAGLSEGAEIGIGIAFGVGGTASLAITLFYFWRRSRARRVHQTRTSNGSSGSSAFDDPMAKPELPAENTLRRKLSTRFGFRQLTEADEGTPMSEMDSLNTKFELEGDSPPIVEAGSGRLSVASETMSTECGTLSSMGSYTLPPGSPRPPGFI